MSNLDFTIEAKSGRNSLFNVLKAYANYDPEIGYSQGMNVMVSWILKFMQIVNHQNKLEYDEENSFYLILHIMNKLECRNIFDKNLSKTIQLLE